MRESEIKLSAIYSIDREQVIAGLGTNVQTGLTEEEVSRRLESYGENRLREKKKKTTFQRFMDQFKDAMIIVLLIAAAISFVVAFIEMNMNEFFEPVLILLIVILNAIMGVVQESKAEKALEALKSLSALKAKVIREGVEQVLDSAFLVPGDIVRLEAGDFVPADARLIKSSSLKVEESALTGESVPSEKKADEAVPENAALGDRVNMVFSGCSVAYGSGLAVVTSTGMETEMGKIATLLENEGEQATPLQQKLTRLGKQLGILAIIACAVVFVLGLMNGLPPLELFMVAVALAVSAIPEGLPAIVTIVLSIGVQRMVKKNAIIRRLPAVETLGSASVICSDKTGTLTQNRMTLMKAYIAGEEKAEDISPNNSEGVRKLLKYGTLCCDGTVIFEDGKEQHIGDPTETSIIVGAYKNGMDQAKLKQDYPQVAALPFDSDRKLMTTVHQIDGKLVVITKGAFDKMITICHEDEAGKIAIEKATQINEEMSAASLRVLSIGYKIVEKVSDNPTFDELESDLTFFGLVGMIDPPRPEAKDAVEVCRIAGIRPVMITGDHVTTAKAIAAEIGIFHEGDRAVTGVELDKMSDEELANEVEHISVYARVSPENKIRIVKAWQDKGQVVSMTGDGVNDAPALKAADIGCAMGITGTDVAKGAADMTLTDDNFATIVEAVKEGRGIYANIKKVVGFLLGTNIGEVLTVLVAMILWHETPLVAMQLLWINLVTDSLPAIALGMEDVEKDIMTQKPKPKNEGIFANRLGIKVFVMGMLFATITLIGFRVGEIVTGDIVGGETMAFLVLSLSQLVQAYNMRTNHSLFSIGIFSNKKLNIACLISLVLTLIVLFTPLQIVFGLMHLPIQLYVLGFVLVLVPFPVMEIAKALKLL